MSYTDRLKDERQKSHADIIAKNILDGIEELENAGGRQARRRWFWELLQNAKDVSDPTPGVRVQVEILDGAQGAELVFRHDGRPFEVGDIVRLIEQNSGKERDANGDDRTTGRFGTGFLTTQLLARQVKVDGVVQEGDRPAKRFSLPLNREGDTKEAIKRGVEQSFQCLDTLFEQTSVAEYVPGGYDTAFRYQLNDEGEEVARAGIKDLHRSLPLTLVLNRAISSVEVVHEGQTYRRSEVRQITKQIELVHVTRETRSGDEETSSSAQESFICITGETVSLAIPVDEVNDTITLKELDGDVPRLFCDFPLIGSEAFGMPLAINSSLFYPIEKRNGIYLTRRKTKVTEENRRRFDEVVNLYNRLIAVGAKQEWEDLYVLAGLRVPAAEISWLYKPWYKKRVLQPIRRKLIHAPIVETATGERKSLKDPDGKSEDVYLPSWSNEGVREKIWEIVYSWTPEQLPKRSHIHEWYKRAWRSCREATVPWLVGKISQQKNLSNLAKSVRLTGSETVKWLADIVQFIEENELSGCLGPYEYKGKSYRRPILPNQNGRFRLRDDLFLDDEIGVELKDIAAMLGEDVRAILLDSGIQVAMPAHKTKNDKYVADKIREHVRRNLKDMSPDEQTKHAHRRLFQWLCTNNEYARDLFGALYDNRIKLRSNEDLAEDFKKAENYNRVEQILSDAGITLEDLPDLIDARNASQRNGPLEANGEGQAFAKLSEVIKGCNIQDGESFQALLGSNAALFQHIPERSIEAYKRWLNKVKARKIEVLDYLEKQPAYDCSGWQDDDAFPTIVTGVKKHGRDIFLVVRPSDGEMVVFYHDLEIETLDIVDSEMWISNGHGQPRCFTLGGLLKALDVKPQTGIRLTLN